MISGNEISNYEAFRDALQGVVVQRLLPDTKKKRIKGRKNEIKLVAQPVDTDTQILELSDFIEYLSEEIFEALPEDLRKLSFSAVQNDAQLKDKYEALDDQQLDQLIEALPSTIIDSLLSYQMVKDDTDLGRFVEPVLVSYISTSTAAPSEYTPSDASSKPDGCEICDRTQLPLTYHHLIPREMHERVLKRNWHADWELNKVAWLCRACHSFVHRIASNEELAKSYYSIDLLLEREDVQKWALWASRIRWKAR